MDSLLGLFDGVWTFVVGSVIVYLLFFIGAGYVIRIFSTFFKLHIGNKKIKELDDEALDIQHVRARTGVNVTNLKDAELLYEAIKEGKMSGIYFSRAFFSPPIRGEAPSKIGLLFSISFFIITVFISVFNLPGNNDFLKGYYKESLNGVNYFINKYEIINVNKEVVYNKMNCDSVNGFAEDEKARVFCVYLNSKDKYVNDYLNFKINQDLSVYKKLSIFLSLLLLLSSYVACSSLSYYSLASSFHEFKKEHADDKLNDSV